MIWFDYNNLFIDYKKIKNKNKNKNKKKKEREN